MQSVHGRFEPEIYRQRFRKATKQQARSNEHQHCQPYFRHHQGTPRATLGVSWPGAMASIAQRIQHIGLHALEAWSDSADQTRHTGQDGRADQRGPTDSNLTESRQRIWEASNGSAHESLSGKGRSNTRTIRFRTLLPGINKTGVSPAGVQERN